MVERTHHLSRRNFLLTVGAGGVAAAAIVVKNPAPPRPPVSDQSKRATRGYQATAHVNHYYRTAKV
ncbi:MAG TPA: twin-arginine translocation signal domain-containing protein [Burkholderiales bacterium]|nr:twin-arginine translocation signal domain-containing protein [Burkholderiales bacterium]